MFCFSQWAKWKLSPRKPPFFSQTPTHLSVLVSCSCYCSQLHLAHMNKSSCGRKKTFCMTRTMYDRNVRHTGSYLFILVILQDPFCTGKVYSTHTLTHKLTNNGSAISRQNFFFMTVLVFSQHHDLVWSDSAKNRYTTVLQQELNYLPRMNTVGTAFIDEAW